MTICLKLASMYICKNFALFSREDDAPRRFNLIGEDDGLDKKQQIKMEYIS